MNETNKPTGGVIATVEIEFNKELVKTFLKLLKRDQKRLKKQKP
jgi:hypothetical protein